MTAKFAAQPSGGTMAGLLAALATNRSYSQFDAAVAYATIGGVRAIQGAMPARFGELDKRWLVGIDWCRSQPEALELLAGLPHSSVRVHDGKVVSGRLGCVPTLPFHPKGFIFTGDRSGALVVGSANLSRNGLTKGHEADIALEARRGTARWNAIAESGAWFEGMWTAASPLASIRTAYRLRFDSSANLGQPTPTDDDALDTSALGRHSFTTTDLTKLRACQHFWIEAGNLHSNRGSGVPGNQLMLRALSRVYFGFSANNLARDSSVGSIEITYGGTSHVGRTLRYSNNAMDVLSLPVPGQGAPVSYDADTLQFRRRTQGQHCFFELSVGSSADKLRWRQRSQALGALFAMRGSGRLFGVY